MEAQVARSERELLTARTAVAVAVEQEEKVRGPLAKTRTTLMVLGTFFCVGLAEDVVQETIRELTFFFMSLYPF